MQAGGQPAAGLKNAARSPVLNGADLDRRHASA